MTKKKDFMKNNPAAPFISAADEQPTVEVTGEMLEDMKGEMQAPPKGYKVNHQYVEVKSKRIVLLVQPSVAARIKEAAKEDGVSLNELMNALIKSYLKQRDKQ